MNVRQSILHVTFVFNATVDRGNAHKQARAEYKQGVLEGCAKCLENAIIYFT